MKLLEAAVLGLVQGMTEFVPISSTAHLRIVPALLGWPDSGAAMTAVLQLGTLGAVVGYFLPDLRDMVRGVLSPGRRNDPRAARLVQLVIGTFPIGIAGLLFKDVIEGPLRALLVVAGALITVALLMAVVEWCARPTRVLEDANVRDALLVGAAQALALVPGVSRSGITLCAAMLLGMRRDSARAIPSSSASRRSPLPHRTAAAVLRGDASLAALGVGLLASAAAGYASIAWLLRYLRARSTFPFVVYRIALGLFLILGTTLGWLS